MSKSDFNIHSPIIESPSALLGIDFQAFKYSIFGTGNGDGTVIVVVDEVDLDVGPVLMEWAAL